MARSLQVLYHEATNPLQANRMTEPEIASSHHADVLLDQACRLKSDPDISSYAARCSTSALLNGFFSALRTPEFSPAQKEKLQTQIAQVLKDRTDINKTSLDTLYENAQDNEPALIALASFSNPLEHIPSSWLAFLHSPASIFKPHVPYNIPKEDLFLSCVEDRHIKSSENQRLYNLFVVHLNIPEHQSYAPRIQARQVKNILIDELQSSTPLCLPSKNKM